MNELNNRNEQVNELNNLKDQIVGVPILEAQEPIKDFDALYNILYKENYIFPRVIGEIKNYIIWRNLSEASSIATDSFAKYIESYDSLASRINGEFEKAQRRLIDAHNAISNEPFKGTPKLSPIILKAIDINNAQIFSTSSLPKNIGYELTCRLRITNVELNIYIAGYLAALNISRGLNESLLRAITTNKLNH